MIIIPAIDIVKGKVVRLYQGDFLKEKLYADDPVQTALMWQKKGARFLHIVDLEGAKYGEMQNKDVIADIIKEISILCEVGGGLRDEDDIEYFFNKGAERVVLGTSAIEDTKRLKTLVSKFNEKIVISIDFSGNRVVKKGWQEETDVQPINLAVKMQALGVKRLIVTDVQRDGTLTGPNTGSLQAILDSVEIPVIASGGISSIEDIKKLKDIKSRNLEGVIIGRALYEGTVKLEEAIKLC